MATSFFNNNCEDEVEELESAKQYADLARDWAIKMDGLVDGIDFSSKFWANQAAIGAGARITIKEDGTPLGDQFTTLNFGAGVTATQTTTNEVLIQSTGQILVETFDDGVDFTAGTSDDIALSVEAVSKNNIDIYFDGIYQNKETYDVSGVLVTFTSVIPVGVGEIEVVYPRLMDVGIAAAENVTFGSTNVDAELVSLDARLDVGEATLISLDSRLTIVERSTLVNRPFPNVAAVDTATFLQTGDFVEWLGYTTPGDGGGNKGEIGTGFGPADNGSVFDLSGSGLQARGLFPGAIGNVKQFGVVGDGIADDRPAIVACDTFGGIYLIDKDTDLTLSSPYTATNAYFKIDPQAVLDDATADGDFTTSSGFLGNSANKYRIPTRLFVGQAADKFNGNSLPDTGTSWLSTTADGPAYIPANALFLAMTNPGDPSYAVCGAAKVDTGGTRAAQAFAGVAINQGAASARGGIFEIQHETTTNTSWGLEVQVKNASGGGQIISPYGAVSNMTFGLQITAGGDDAFGPVSTDPATAAMIISASQSAGAPGWFTGIQFREDCVVGAEPEAIAFADGLAIKWYEPDTRTPAAVIKSDITVAGKTLKQIFSDDQLHFQNEAAADIFTLATTPTAINRVQINATDTGIPPRVSALGTDTNIDLRFLPKGTGLVRFGAHAAIGSETVTGYIQIKDDTGVTRKLAVVS